MSRYRASASPALAPAPPTPLPVPARPGGRIPALDAARALAVVAMVFGHTLDALLAPEVRAEPLVAAYWGARGFTAPLFMVVSGWAVAIAASRGGARGLGLVGARLPRVLLLLAIGVALRWPGWGVSQLREGDRTVWAHLLGFDALHTIAVALLSTTLVLAARWGDGRKAAALGLLVLVAVALGSFPIGPIGPDALPALALAQAVGGTSTFPLFPWVGYFFLGAILGLLSGRGEGRRAVAVAAVGAALAAAALLLAPEVEAGAARLFGLRAGVVLLFLAALSRIPAGLARGVRPMGRASLAVYAIHLPIVYGWSTHEGLLQRIGPRLPLGAALAIGAAVLVGAFALGAALSSCARTLATSTAALRPPSAPARARPPRAPSRPAA